MTNSQPLTKEKVIIGRIHEGSAFDSQLPMIAAYNVRFAVEGLKKEINDIIAYNASDKLPTEGWEIELAFKTWFPVFVDEDKKQ